jgi:hypothetical protein
MSKNKYGDKPIERIACDMFNKFPAQISGTTMMNSTCMPSNKANGLSICKTIRNITNLEFF